MAGIGTCIPCTAAKHTTCEAKTRSHSPCGCPTCGPTPGLPRSPK